MEEKVFHVDRNFCRKKIEDLTNINAIIQEAIEADVPVYFTVPYGTFAGSTVRLKVNKYRRPSDLAKVFRSVQYGPNINEDHYWEGTAEGTNRNFQFRLRKAIPRYGREYPFSIVIGGDRQTEIVKKEKNAAKNLVDFFGREIVDGDYVLMYSGPFELKQTGSPFRMLRYTGKRSEKQAQFTYVKMHDDALTVNGCRPTEGGTVIRVGLNSGGKEITNTIYGVKIDVDESLATAMQMTDHDMSIYPVHFHVGLTN
ncbi:MAG: hypothetical protein M0R77_13115 [Gammaproteobacteria bacterium]|nr:hypothetical protein [Gammaproteobacteria bacterium]